MKPPHPPLPFHHLMPITERPAEVFVRGAGAWLWDAEGKRYLDWLQGWAVNALGHCPPLITQALHAQSTQLLTVKPGVLQPAGTAARATPLRIERFCAGVFRQHRRRSQ